MDFTTPNDGTDDGASVSAVAVVGADNAEAVGQTYVLQQVNPTIPATH